jgi:acyl-CoA synthetase (AMP-forming)/AMP-acid ligase II
MWPTAGVPTGRLPAARGLGDRDTLGLLLRNRPEFHLADTAALLAGATPFSMYNHLITRAAGAPDH